MFHLCVTVILLRAAEQLKQKFCLSVIEIKKKLMYACLLKTLIKCLNPTDEINHVAHVGTSAWL